MVLTILLLILILFIVGVLFIPMELYIDTNTNQYYARLKGLAIASIEQDKEEIFRIRLKIPFKDFLFYPLKKLGMPKKSTKKKRKKKSKGRLTPKTMLRLLKSFKIKKLKVDIDTGDCITNAKLYPVFAFLDYYIGGFHINFEGRNQMVLLLRNRPIYIIRSFINY